MHRLSWQPPLAMLALLVSISFQAVNVYAQQPDPSDLLQESLPPKYVTLGECLEVALTFQPRILAELNSQLSTEIQANYLNKLRLVSHFSKPLNARIGQSEIGINRARAAIDQQIEDTYYMVRRAYFTYIFAKRLESFASPMENLVARTEKALAIKKLIEKPTGKWTSDHEKQLLILRAEHTLIKEKLNNAKAGIRESIALLMEEMGGGIKLGYQPIPTTTKFPTLSPNFLIWWKNIQAICTRYGQGGRLWNWRYVPKTNSPFSANRLVPSPHSLTQKQSHYPLPKEVNLSCALLSRVLRRRTTLQAQGMSALPAPVLWPRGRGMLRIRLEIYFACR